MNVDVSSPLPSRKGLVFLLAAVFFAGLAYMIHLGAKPLAHVDECLTADRSQEMLLANSFLTILQDFEPNYNKPPLHYYLTAASLAVFPDGEFAVRFASCLFGLGCALLAGLFVRHFYPESLWLPSIAALFILLCPVFVHSARQGHLDTGLTFFGLLGVYAFILALRNDGAWIWVGWAIGLGSLHKFPLAVPWILLALWVYRRELPPDLRQNSHFRRAILLAIGLSLLWPAIQILQCGYHYIDEFFMDQMLGRVLDPAHRLAKSDPWFYFGRLETKWPLMGLLALPLLLLGLFPKYARDVHPRRPSQLFSILGLAYFLVIFSMSGKSVRYLVPLVPCVALAATFLFYQLSGRREWVVLVLFLVLQAFGFYRLTREWKGPPNELPHLVDLSLDLGKHWQPDEEVMIYNNARDMYASLISFYSKVPRKMHVKTRIQTNFNGITTPTFLSLGSLQTMAEVKAKWGVQQTLLAQQKDLAVWRTVTPPPVPVEPVLPPTAP